MEEGPLIRGEEVVLKLVLERSWEGRGISLWIQMRGQTHF